MASPVPSSASSIWDYIANVAVKNAAETLSQPIYNLPPSLSFQGVPEDAARDEEPFPVSFPDPGTETLPICIVGAGTAGLYAAMILADLGIKFEILEANETCCGGRLYTHRFNGKAGEDAPVGDAARYDYIDMGGMRFPNLGFHKRVFDLFELIGIKDLVIPYRMSDDNTFQCYNDVCIGPQNISLLKEVDAFGVSATKGGIVPDYLVGKDNNGSTLTKEALGPYVEAFRAAVKLTDETKVREAIAKAWAKVAEHDVLSTRAFLTRPKPDSNSKDSDYPQFPVAVIEWLESLNSSTGLYDQAFVESIIDSVDFGDWNAKTQAGRASTTTAPDWAQSSRTDGWPKDPWSCIDGGSDRIITAMLSQPALISNPPKMGKRVTAIAPSLDGLSMQVMVDGETKPRSYAQVICTAPLGCLNSVDLTKCSLTYQQKTAIRGLNYDSSTKVAIKFEKRWWENKEIMGGYPIRGGVSSSDLPIRTVVYPSYGSNPTSGGEATGVMIASYTWAQDARRMSALDVGRLENNQPSIPQNPLLLDLCLKNLSKLHNNLPVSSMGKVIDHQIFSWYNYPLSRGAFALFGPGQFSSTGKDPANLSMFASLKTPAANGRLHFAGEATSIHHAWVLGALNSAWRAVYTALEGDPSGRLREKLKENWGTPDEENIESLDRLSLFAAYRAI